MLDFFQSSGRVPVSMERLNSCDMGSAKLLAPSRSSRPGISSGAQNFTGLIDFSTFKVSTSVTHKEFSEAWAL